ncbi:MAG: hypothetical protein JWM42_3557, partial [Burkholderia sp.]|nr:hypothetical protein [Burkholderia sp.]
MVHIRRRRSLEQFQPDCEGSAGRSKAVAALP